MYYKIKVKKASNLSITFPRSKGAFHEVCMRSQKQGIYGKVARSLFLVVFINLTKILPDQELNVGRLIFLINNQDNSNQ